MGGSAILPDSRENNKSFDGQNPKHFGLRLSGWPLDLSENRDPKQAVQCGRLPFQQNELKLASIRNGSWSKRQKEIIVST
jgi:hypothetical protein